MQKVCRSLVFETKRGTWDWHIYQAWGSSELNSVDRIRTFPS
jgi:hypothetical protein